MSEAAIGVLPRRRDCEMNTISKKNKITQPAPYLCKRSPGLDGGISLTDEYQNPAVKSVGKISSKVTLKR